MAFQVTSGATLQCSFGATPSALQVLPVKCVTAGTPAANIMDHAPFVNVLPFGMCNSMANPTVAAATAAASGVLTPMPCMPATAAPWAPGSSQVMIGKMPALQDSSRLMCTWGGVIQIVVAAQFTTLTN
ncbi:DUF4280 domain-containing protein [Paraburkholderia sp. A1RI_3L]|uniref:DUF4280 domain-containing protein n=1 Tax=Paraburkholderia TaxID=1822464 RepID=UPI002407D0B8|nr:DUF4280 domain-containing protein [Paraburkholderia sp. SUR17]WEY42342.1 DUF4280 domain-containing protein [Paraburkholderia sp. SUR17]